MSTVETAQLYVFRTKIEGDILSDDIYVIARDFASAARVASYVVESGHIVYTGALEVEEVHVATHINDHRYEAVGMVPKRGKMTTEIDVGDRHDFLDGHEEGSPDAIVGAWIAEDSDWQDEDAPIDEENDEEMHFDGLSPSVLGLHKPKEENADPDAPLTDEEKEGIIEAMEKSIGPRELRKRLVTPRDADNSQPSLGEGVVEVDED